MQMLLSRRLQKAVQMLKFLLSFDVNKWFLRSSSPGSKRIGFKDHNLGLLDAVSIADHTSNESDIYFHALTPGQFTPRQEGSPAAITRTMSSTWAAINVSRSPQPLSPPPLSSSTSTSSGDVDKRADEFIAKFREKLRMEKQVSIELRYASLNRPSTGVVSPVNCSR